VERSPSPTPEFCRCIRTSSRTTTACSTSATDYWAHAAWLEEDVLVREAGKLAGIPGVLIHGRLDISGPPDIAWRMAQAWPGAELHLVEQEGHGAGGRRTTELILAALDHFALRS
jgi:proline iminopeptidase